MWDVAGRASRNCAMLLILEFICVALRLDENPSFPGPHEYFVLSFQAERRVAPMRDLDVDRCAPIGHQFNFDERTRCVDVSDFGMEVIAAVALMFDLQ